MQNISSDEDYFIDNTKDKMPTEEQQNDDNSDATATNLIAQHLDEPIVCKKCNKSFFNRSFYHEHKLKVFNDNWCLYVENVCSVCDEIIGNLDIKQVRTHINGHLFKETYFCKHCHRFERGSIIEQYDHFMTIYSEKRYICRQCRDSFVSKIDLDDHMQEIHPCLTKFPRHIRKWNKHMCELCGKIVTSLPEHMKMHKDIRPYECVNCANRFRTKFSVIRHQQAHRHKLTVCKLCEKHFYWAETFHIHMKKVHPSDDPHSFVCRYCSSKFQCKQSADVHENVHRPYDCTNCPESFELTEELSAHHHQAHADLPFNEAPEVYKIKCPDVSMKNFHMETEYWETATAETEALMNVNYESQKALDELAAYVNRTAKATSIAAQNSLSTLKIVKTESLYKAVDTEDVAYTMPFISQTPDYETAGQTNISLNVKKAVMEADAIQRNVAKIVDSKVTRSISTVSQKPEIKKIATAAATGKCDFTAKPEKVDVTPASGLRKIELKELMLHCKDCNIYFKNELLLIDHRTKTHKKSFRCKMCGIQTDKILEHILKHRYCFVCKTKFETASALLQHQSKAHPKISVAKKQS